MSVTKAIAILNGASNKLFEKAQACRKRQDAEKPKIKPAIQGDNLDGALQHVKNILNEEHTGIKCLRIATRLKEIVAKIDSSKNETMANFVLTSETIFQGLDLQNLIDFTRDFEKEFGKFPNPLGLPPVSTPERVNDYLVNYAHQNNLTLPPNYSAKTHASQDEFLGFLEQYQKNFLKE